MSVKSVTVVCDRCKKEEQICGTRKETKIQDWFLSDDIFIENFQWRNIDLCYDCKKELWRLVTNWSKTQSL